MKLVMTLLVRDEDDIIRDNIEFHLSQGVDQFIATDNRSDDATTEILREYENKGVLYYIYEGEDNYNQHHWVTRMARMAYIEYGADWVINNDADEFWWPKSGDLKDAFNQVGPEYNVVHAKRYDFVVTSNCKQPFYRYMLYRKKHSLNPLGKPLHPKVAHRGSTSVIVNQGNHSVEGIGDLRSVGGLVDIFHFPIRSYEQLENKVVKGGAAYERNRELPSSVGLTWRELYKEYKVNNHIHDYYSKKLYTAERISDELESGSIVLDDRLSEYFAKLSLASRVK